MYGINQLTHLKMMVGLIFGLIIPTGLLSQNNITTSVEKSKVAMQELMNDLPSSLHFEQNEGQMERAVLFKANDAQATHYFLNNEIRTIISGSKREDHFTYALKFINPSEHCQVQGSGCNTSSLQGQKNYIRGNERYANVSQFRHLNYTDIWNGIDLSFYETEGHLKYDFIIEPGSDPSQVRFLLNGVEDIRINKQGELEFLTPLGLLQKGQPYTYQKINGQTIEVPAKYQINGNAISFKLGEYDKTKPLIIDPIALKWAGYLFDHSGDYEVHDAYFDGNNDRILVTGYYSESSFPATLGASAAVNADAFIMALAADGSSIIWSTLIGGIGTGFEQGNGIFVNDMGDVFVNGETSSADFPINGVTPAYDNTINGAGDHFIIRLTSDGTTLKYGTFIGTSANDDVYNRLAVFGDKVYSTMNLKTANISELPATGYVSPGFAGGMVIYSINTAVGGAGGLEAIAHYGSSVANFGLTGWDIEVDGAGNIYVAGRDADRKIEDSMFTADAIHNITDIRAIGTYHHPTSNTAVSYLAKFSSDLNNLEYATVLQPVLEEFMADFTDKYHIEVDGVGNIYALTSHILYPNDPSEVSFAPHSGTARNIQGLNFNVGNSPVNVVSKIKPSNPSEYDFISVLAGDDYTGVNGGLEIDHKGRIHISYRCACGPGADDVKNVLSTNGAIPLSASEIDPFYNEQYAVLKANGALEYATPINVGGPASYLYAIALDEEKCTAYLFNGLTNGNKGFLTPSYYDHESEAQVTVRNTTPTSDNRLNITVFHEPVPKNAIDDFQTGNDQFCVGGLIYQGENDGPILGDDTLYTSGDGSSDAHNLPDYFLNGVLKPYPTPASPAINYQWQKSIDSGMNWSDVAGGNLAVLKPDTENTALTVQYRRLIISGCCDTIISNVAEADIVGNFNLNINAPTAPVYYCSGENKDLGISISGASGNISWQWYNGFDPISNLEINPASGTGLDASLFTATIPASQTENGFYRLVVTDAGGCKKEGFVTIGQLSAPAGTGPIMPLCPGATPAITLGAAANPDFEYSWMGPNGFTSNEANPMVDVVGDYFLQVKIPTDATFCAAGETTVNVPDFMPHDPVLATMPDVGFCQTEAPSPLGLSGSAPADYVFQWSPAINLDDATAFNPLFDPGTLPFGTKPIAAVEYTFTALRTTDGCIFETTNMVTDTAYASANAGADKPACNSAYLGNATTTGLHFQWEAVKTNYSGGLSGLVADGDFTFDGNQGNLGTEKFALVTAPIAAGEDCYEVEYVIRASYVPFPNNCFSTDSVKVLYCCGGVNGMSCAEPVIEIMGIQDDCAGEKTVMYTTLYEGFEIEWTTYSVDGVIQPAGTPPQGLFTNVNGSAGVPIDATGPHPDSVIVNFDDTAWGWSGANFVVYEATTTGFINASEVGCSARLAVFSGQNARPIIGVLDKSLCTFPAPSVQLGSGNTAPYAVSGVDYTQAPNSALNWQWTELGGGTTSINADEDSPFPVLNPPSSQIYLVRVEDPASGCVSQDTMTISAIEIVADAGSDISGICEGSLVQLGSPAEPNHTYSWTPTGGLNFPIGTANSMVAQPFLTAPNAPGGVVYSVTATETTTGCQATDEVIITTNTDAPTALSPRNYTNCAGTIRFVFSEFAQAGHTYEWSVFSGAGSLAWFDDTTNPRPRIAIPEGTAAGVYEFQLTKTRGNCGSVTQIYTINVVAPATPDLGPDVMSVCTTPYTELSTIQETNVRYRWSPIEGLFTDANGTTPYTNSLNANNFTMYVGPSNVARTYIIAAHNNSCFAYDTITVLPSISIDVDAGDNQYYCPEGAELTLGVANAGVSHAWTAIGYTNNPNGTTSAPSFAEETIMLSYLSSTTDNVISFSQASIAPGIYVYELTSTETNGCFLSDEVTITVPDLHAGFVGTNQSICFGESIQIGLNTNPSNYFYYWSALNPSSANNTINDPTLEQPIVTPTATTTYQVRATEASSGCMLMETITVNVTRPPDIEGVDVPAVCGMAMNQDLTALIPDYGTYFNPIWYKNSVPGAVIANPNNVTTLATTDYFLRVENEFGCPNTARITINADNPQAPIILPETTVTCPTETISLLDFQSLPSDPSFSLEWHTDNTTNPATLITNTVVGPGTYYLFEISPNSCTSGSNNLLVRPSNQVCPPIIPPACKPMICLPVKVTVNRN